MALSGPDSKPVVGHAKSLFVVVVNNCVEHFPAQAAFRLTEDLVNGCPSIDVQGDPNRLWFMAQDKGQKFGGPDHWVLGTHGTLLHLHLVDFVPPGEQDRSTLFS